jgi:DNA-binding MarR family transcriptional regulator
LPLFGGGPRDAILMVLAQRGNTPAGKLAALTGRTIPGIKSPLRILQRSGLVGKDEKSRWVIDRRHPAQRALRLLMKKMGAIHGLDYARVKRYESSPAVTPFPDLDAVAPAELDNEARTRVLLYIAATEPCSILEIVDALGIALRTTFKIVHHFRRTGILDALVTPSGRSIRGVRITRAHPLTSELRAFLMAMVREVHPEFAALKRSRRHRVELQQRLRINRAARAAGIETADWNVVPYRGRTKR